MGAHRTKFGSPCPPMVMEEARFAPMGAHLINFSAQAHVSPMGGGRPGACVGAHAQATL